MVQWLRQTTVARLRRWRNHVPRTLSSGAGVGLRFQPAGADAAYARGDRELPVQQVIARHLQAGMAFYDIGANVGFFALIAARLVGPGGHVYAFEPVPANAAAIRRNAQLNRFAHLSVYAQAVSDRSGRTNLILAEHIGGAMLEDVGRPPDATQAIEVETITIDDAIARGQLIPPNLVKIDVEGAEPAVLRGMHHTIANHRPVIIYEIDDVEVHGLERKLAECRSFLAARDYQFRQLVESYPNEHWQVAHIVATPRE